MSSYRIGRSVYPASLRGEGGLVFAMNTNHVSENKEIRVLNSIEVVASGRPARSPASQVPSASRASASIQVHGRIRCKQCGTWRKFKVSREHYLDGFCRSRCKKVYEQSGFYRSREWRSLRYQAIRRDGGACGACGSKGVLHVDHIKPRSKYPSLALVLENLQVLCADCNIGKGNKDSIDWRAR